MGQQDVFDSQLLSININDCQLLSITINHYQLLRIDPVLQNGGRLMSRVTWIEVLTLAMIVTPAFLTDVPAEESSRFANFTEFQNVQRFRRARIRGS